MKRLKTGLSVVLIASILLGLAGCGTAEVEETGDQIIEYMFAGKTSKLEDYLDEDDDDYDEQCEVFELFYDVLDDEIDFISDLEYEYEEEINVNKDSASISFDFEIEDEEYEFELNLKKDGKEWIVDDNEEFIVSVFGLVFDISDNEGSDSLKDEIEDAKDEFGVKSNSKLAQEFYDFLALFDIDEGVEDIEDDEFVEVEETEPEETEPEETEPTETPTPTPSGSNPNYIDTEYSDFEDIFDMSMFIAMPGYEIDEDNDIQELIAEKTGVRVEEVWLTGQTAEMAVASIVAGGNFPDFIYSADMSLLYDADVLVPWDDYIELYPNIKEMFTPEEWELFRQPDGHIYWVDVFNNTYGEPLERNHNDGAFWIQARVLEWADYPVIETLDEYFDLLDSYYEANPELEKGVSNIPYVALCDDWRYFCLEEPTSFLDGYPNDKTVIVNTTDFDKPTVVDDNTTDTAKAYFKKLNEQYNAGYMYSDFDSLTYDDYVKLLATGRVLGMYDHYWDFAYTLMAYMDKDLVDMGCEYVPLGLTIEKGMTNRYHSYKDTVNFAGGIGVTTSCPDRDRAFRFLNYMLDQEIHDLRFWGIEGVDYLIDDEGMYYRTEEMLDNWNDLTYRASHYCVYSYMPQWLGTSHDGKNAMQPLQQASVALMSYSEPLKECYDAYGAGGNADMLNSSKELYEEPWYPMYPYTNQMSTSTPGGLAYKKIEDLKHDMLPELVKAEDFDAVWEEYMTKYDACNPDDYLEEMQAQLDAIVAGN